MAIRGSKLHLLRLLESAEFLPTINRLIDGTGASITAADQWRPTGLGDRKEWYLPTFCRLLYPERAELTALRNWWVPEPWRPPTWDLISTAAHADRFGLLVVEAKANEDELKRGGKSLRGDATGQSRKNHLQIVACLAEACYGLNSLAGGGFSLSAHSHYQLANRLAHLWKIADCGVPATLLYLGFTGDTYFRSHFSGNAAWQDAFCRYSRTVVPPEFIGRRFVTASGGSIQMLVRSVTIREVSV